MKMRNNEDEGVATTTHVGADALVRPVERSSTIFPSRVNFAGGAASGSPAARVDRTLLSNLFRKIYIQGCPTLVALSATGWEI
jgi:hypothetical protein